MDAHLMPGRTPQGVRGLKLANWQKEGQSTVSHSARSAWIETLYVGPFARMMESHSARSAWIETKVLSSTDGVVEVALRKECVD